MQHHIHRYTFVIQKFTLTEVQIFPTPNSFQSSDMILDTQIEHFLKNQSNLWHSLGCNVCSEKQQIVLKITEMWNSAK